MIVKKNIKTRKLPKRVAEFSLEKMGKPDGSVSDFETVRRFIEKTEIDPDGLRGKIFEKIREAYYERGKIVDFTLFDIYVSFPQMIKTRTDFLLVSKDGRTRYVSEKKYIREWAESFAAEKWRGYVFCNSNVDRKIASVCAEECVGELY